MAVELCPPPQPIGWQRLWALGLGATRKKCMESDIPPPNQGDSDLGFAAGVAPNLCGVYPEYGIWKRVNEGFWLFFFIFKKKQEIKYIFTSPLSCQKAFLLFKKCKKCKKNEHIKTYKTH